MSLCLYTCMQPCLQLASSMMPWGIRSQVSMSLGFSSSMPCFGFCVMSGSVERWDGKLYIRLIAKAIRISHAKFHCNRLTAVQDIQDYASLIFLGHIIYATVCQYICPSVSTSVHLSYLWAVKTLLDVPSNVFLHNST